MLVGFITTYAISAYHHWCCGFDSRSGRRVQHYVIKFVCGVGNSDYVNEKQNFDQGTRIGINYASVTLYVYFYHQWQKKLFKATVPDILIKLKRNLKPF
jgi:hypothetical protein